jgi:hypothetical protein
MPDAARVPRGPEFVGASAISNKEFGGATDMNAVISRSVGSIGILDSDCNARTVDKVFVPLLLGS